MINDKSIQRSKKPTVVKEQLSSLGKILEKDKQLSEDKQRLTLFLSLAKLYDDDLKNNLYRTSFELDDLYSTADPQAWLSFLKYPPVRRYIEEYIEDKQLAEAKRALSDGFAKTTDAINVQRNIEDKRKLNSNNNIIVFLMPQKKYRGVDDDDGQ